MTSCVGQSASFYIANIGKSDISKVYSEVITVPYYGSASLGSIPAAGTQPNYVNLSFKMADNIDTLGKVTLW